MLEVLLGQDAVSRPHFTVYPSSRPNTDTLLSVCYILCLEILEIIRNRGFM